MKFHFALLGAIFVFLSGCAWTSQEVKLDPNVNVTQQDFGHGKTIYIDVEDERQRRAFGNKVPQGGGEITPMQEPKAVLTEALVQGMTRLGFKPILEQRANIPKLKTELRAIDYKVAMGFWSGGLTVDVGLKSICIVDGIGKYEKFYRGHHAENIQVAQSQENNEIYINSAFSQAINNLLSDSNLLNCLVAAGKN